MTLSRARLGAFLIATGCAVTACSFLITADKEQCKTTADCVARGPSFTGLVCRPEDGVCVKEGCSTNAECIDANEGKPFVCNKTKRICVALETSSESDGGPGANCKPFADADVIRNDDTIWIGLMSDTTGILKILSEPLVNLTEFARKEIMKGTGGVPSATPGGKARPLGLFFCNDETNEVKAVSAGKYMVETLGVPAVISHASESATIKLTAEVFGPNRTLVLSQTAPPLGAMIPSGDPRAVYATLPHTDNQPLYFDNLVSKIVEPRVRAALDLPATEQIRLAVIGLDTQFVNDQINRFPGALTFNGKSVADNKTNFKILKYSVTANPAELSAIHQQIVDFQPHIIIASGFGEQGPAIVLPIEQMWKATAFRPQWLTQATSLSPPLFEALGSKPEFAARYLWQSPLWETPEAITTNEAFARENPELPKIELLFFGLAMGGYDSMYMIAYVIAANGANPVTGENLIRALPKVLPPNDRKVLAGPDELAKGFDAFAPGGAGAIDFQGRLGPFDLDPRTGRIETWPFGEFCFKPPPTSAGITYDEKTSEIVGTPTCGILGVDAGGP